MKMYLGDGVYAEIDSEGTIILTTEDGISVTNTIYIDRRVWGCLLNFIRKHNEATP